MPLVSVGIVTWNSLPTIASCLESLLDQTFRDFEVNVIDNASQDGTASLIQAQFGGRVRLTVNPTNEGYCRAHNQAIGASSAEYVLTLNPDVFLTPTFLQSMTKAIEADPEIGSVNGKLLRVEHEPLDTDWARNPAETAIIDSAGLMMFRTRRQYLRGYRETVSDRFSRPALIFGPDGAAALYRREMLEDVKVNGQYFDEVFFAHKEDVDLAWRAQLCGWKSLYVPDAVAYHVRGFRPGERERMSPEIKRHAAKNRYLMILKNELLGTFARDWAHILSYEARILGYVLLFEQSSVRAYWDFLRLAPHALRWRKVIQSKRRAEVAYIAGLFDGKGPMDNP